MANQHKRVVAIPVDNSENSKAAFDWYISTGYKEGDLCVLIHDIESPYAHTVSFKDPIRIPFEQWRDLLQKNIDESQEIIDMYQAECEKLKISSSYETASGEKPGQAICDKINDIKADCVVIGYRKLTGIQRVLSGTLSHYIVTNCGRPVTIVPPPTKEVSPK